VWFVPAQARAEASGVDAFQTDTAPASVRRGLARLADDLPAALAAALLAALALFAPSAAASAKPARPADSFVDSIGVNTHTYYNDTPYFSEFDAVRARLAELGVRHIRENLMPDRPDQYEHLNQLASIGIGSTLILGSPTESPEGPGALVSVLKSELSGAVDAVEGPNEFDMQGDPNWIAHLTGYQRQLYDAVKADPSLAGLPVVGPSIVQGRNQEALGDISASLDYGNIHSYPDGYSPEGNLSTHLGRAADNSGAAPVMATETGYHTALGWTGEHHPVSEQAMAVYTPRMFLEYFRRGIARTFSYELLDETPDRTDRESNFGLLRNDLSEKPAFVALRNTIGILRDPGPAFTPETVAYSLHGDTADLHHVLLQKRDGSLYLALWRATDVWDPNSQRSVEAREGEVTIDLERRVNSAEIYQPTVSGGPVGALPIRGGRPRGLDVGAQVVIVKLSLGGTLPGRIRFWVLQRSVHAGGRVAVKGRLPGPVSGRRLRVKIQRRSRGGWRTVSHSRTSRRGVFRKKIRVPARHHARASRLRVVAKLVKPSRSVRLRIRR
jgi:hypothetical protein